MLILVPVPPLAMPGVGDLRRPERRDLLHQLVLHRRARLLRVKQIAHNDLAILVDIIHRTAGGK